MSDVTKPKYESFSEDNSFSLQIDTDLSAGLENAMREMRKAKNIKPAFHTTTTIKDVAGVEGLSISTTGSMDKKFEFNENVAVQYEKKTSSGLTLKAGACFASGSATLDVMVEDSDGFGVGIEANVSLNLMSLLKNGIYLVSSVPLCGMQVVLKYNIITQKVVIILRQPLPPANDEDKKGADECECVPIFVTVDLIEERYQMIHDEIVEEYASGTLLDVNLHLTYFQYIRNRQTQQVGHRNTVGRNVINEIGNDIGNVIGGIGNGIGGIGNGIGNVIDGIGEGIAEFLRGIGPKKREVKREYAYN